MNDEINKIVETILNISKKYNVKVDKIILFGSRARGDYREDSDWDILLVTEEKVKYDIIVEMTDELVEKGIDPQIINVTKEHFEEYKDITGDISYMASSEGIVLWSRQ
ncbi:nucleotidyltransferase [Nanoarchaeota archaeon]